MHVLNSMQLMKEQYLASHKNVGKDLLSEKNPERIQLCNSWQIDRFHDNEW